MTDLTARTARAIAATRPFVARAELGTTVMRTIIELVYQWYVRRLERSLMLELDDLALHDIGLTRADVYREATKPFWRA